MHVILCCKTYFLNIFVMKKSIKKIMKLIIEKTNNNVIMETGFFIK